MELSRNDKKNQKGMAAICKESQREKEIKMEGKGKKEQKQKQNQNRKDEKWNKN